MFSIKGQSIPDNSLVYGRTSSNTRLLGLRSSLALGLKAMGLPMLLGGLFSGLLRVPIIKGRINASDGNLFYADSEVRKKSSALIDPPSKKEIYNPF